MKQGSFPEVSMSTALLPDDPQLRERFSELKPPLAPQAAVIEANRCLNCFDAPCTAACPRISMCQASSSASPPAICAAQRCAFSMPTYWASCARACPVDVLCEGACVLHRHNRKPIQIALLQRHAMDAFHVSGEMLAARLAAADKACEWRASVPVPHRWPVPLSFAAAGARSRSSSGRPLPGGLNTYGVAEYKLRAAESLREVEMIRRLGVEFRFGMSIDTQSALAALESEFDFVFLGLGLGAMQRLGIPGEDQEGVMNALELIAGYKTGDIRQFHGTVVVVGAGNTAIDAANAARRLGAQTVYMLYRRSETDMSAFDFEYEHAKQEGVQFLWRRQPIAIRSDAHGRLLLDTVQMHQAGNKLMPMPDSQFTISMRHGGAGHRPVTAGAVGSGPARHRIA